jgi:hypothetical protein
MATKSKSKLKTKRARPYVPQRPDALAFTLRGFQLVGGPGKSKCYELAKKGVLEMFKDKAGRTLISGKSARALLGIEDSTDLHERVVNALKNLPE